jgi:putative transposase
VFIEVHQRANAAQEYAAMDHSPEDVRIVPLPEAQDVLTDVLRRGAQQRLAQAVEAEVADWIERRQDCCDADGLRQVVRNGHLPQRTLTTRT